MTSIEEGSARTPQAWDPTALLVFIVRQRWLAATARTVKWAVAGILRVLSSSPRPQEDRL